MSHSADYAWAPLMAVLAEYHSSMLSDELVESLKTFKGERNFTAQAYYPPYDLVPRNISTWLSSNLTIGAESYRETVVGGPSISQEAFNPAVVQWTTGSEIGFISVSDTINMRDVVVPIKDAETPPTAISHGKRATD